MCSWRGPLRCTDRNVLASTKTCPISGEVLPQRFIPWRVGGCRWFGTILLGHGGLEEQVSPLQQCIQPNTQESEKVLQCAGRICFYLLAQRFHGTRRRVENFAILLLWAGAQAAAESKDKDNQMNKSEVLYVLHARSYPIW